MKNKKERIDKPQWALFQVNKDKGKRLSYYSSSFQGIDLIDVVMNMCNYLGLAYYEGRLCTKKQAEEIYEAIKENTGVKK